MEPVTTPRDYLIERLMALMADGVVLDDAQQAELRLCRYLASLSPDPGEFLRLLGEQSESDFVPRSSRTAADALVRGWQARTGAASTPDERRRRLAGGA